MVGAVLSTVTGVLAAEAGAVLPVMSTPVPAPMEIPRVPSPLMALMVTVRVAPLPLPTATVPVAVPVLLRVMSARVRLLAMKLVSV